MYKIQTLNKISPLGLDYLDTDKYIHGDKIKNPEGILVRSASLHDIEFENELLAIARAGAGVNNIPVEKCTEKGIVVFNTPGANANAVKELVIAGLLLSSRKIVEGILWAKALQGKGDDIPALVEKGKNAFVGPELEGKKLGVIGLGAIGRMVANTAINMHMEVYGNDPFITVDSAWQLSRSIKNAPSRKAIYENCDYITLHVPVTADTTEMLNKDSFALMKDGVHILNFSRGELVNEDDLAEALKSGKVASYVTDFPNEKVLSLPNVIAIPHLGASTPEAEDNCAVMAVHEITDYLENGNIKNSVNFPSISSERSSGQRLCITHKNIPNMLSKISAVLGEENINIENMLSKSKNEISYAILDLATNLPEDSLAHKMADMEGIIRFRIIK